MSYILCILKCYLLLRISWGELLRHPLGVGLRNLHFNEFVRTTGPSSRGTTFIVRKFFLLVGLECPACNFSLLVPCPQY